MEFSLIEWVRELADVQIGVHAKMVAVMLGRHANEKGECFPGFETLCRETGSSNRQLSRAASPVSDDEPASRPQQRKPAAPPSDEIKNLGDLFNRCKAEFELDRHGVMEKLGVKIVDDIGDLEVAYEAIKSLFAGDSKPPDG